MTRIITIQPIGDDQSVLTTGFDPLDVVALVSAQTKTSTWLFRYDAAYEAFFAIATTDKTAFDFSAPVSDPMFAHRAANAGIASGFASIGGVAHSIALLPIEKRNGGEVIGAVVVSVGTSEELHKAQQALVRNSLIVLFGVLAVTGLASTVVAKRLLRPVPALVQATLRIAREQTDMITPFRDRNDEIGDMANAVDTLREALVERGRLRQIRDMAVRLEHMAHHDALTGLPTGVTRRCRSPRSRQGRPHGARGAACPGARQRPSFRSGHVGPGPTDILPGWKTRVLDGKHSSGTDPALRPCATLRCRAKPWWSTIPTAVSCSTLWWVKTLTTMSSTYWRTCRRATPNRGRCEWPPATSARASGWRAASTPAVPGVDVTTRSRSLVQLPGHHARSAAMVHLPG